MRLPGWIVVAAVTIVGIGALPAEPVPGKDDVLLKRQFDEYAERFLQPDDFDLAEKTPVDRPTSAQLDAVQNSLLFEGDIIGMPSDVAAMRRLRDDPIQDEDAIFRKPYHSSLNLVTYPDKLWSDGRVPYVLEEGMTKEQRAAIAQAFDEYKTKTCVRFVPREEDDDDFIYLKRNVAFGCSSYVGRAGGNQTVSLEIDKCFSKGIIAHELMHSLGFFHEHSRTDRDQFVHIAEDNIRQGMMRNFEKYPRKIIDPLGMPYDYESVMHYHKLAFSKNGKATIVPKDPNAEIGQRYRLSETDAAKINKLYGCSEDEIGSNVIIESTTKRPKATTKSSKSRSSSTRWPVRKTTTTTTTEEPTTTEEEEEEVEEESTTARVTTRSTTRSSRTTSDRWAGRKSTTPRTTTTTEESTTDEEEEEEEEEEETTTVETKPKKKCIDLNAHCEMWESLGHCGHSTKYMAHYCRKSCGMCEDGDLIERPSSTAAPKKTGTTKATKATTTTRPTTTTPEETTTTRRATTTTTTTEKPTRRTRRPFSFMSTTTKAPAATERTTSPSTTTSTTTSSTTTSTTTSSPPTTTPKERRRGGSSTTVSALVSSSTTSSPGQCKDKNLFCSYWAKIGECSSESKFMRIFCKKSCGRCNE